MLSVMVRNGDAHLKNFGVLYDDPTSTPRLAPVYDVVTTTAYDEVNLYTQTWITDRTLALKINQRKNYPTRTQLAAFGKKHCNVSQPERAMTKISDAMSDVLNQHLHRLPGPFAQRFASEWDGGRSAVAATSA